MTRTIAISRLTAWFTKRRVAEPLSDMTVDELSQSIKQIYTSVDAACEDLGIAKTELTLLVMKKRNAPERVARKLRYRLASRQAAE